ncbi:MAG: hypothetical protein MJ231_07885, partial [bacterium]|nr:hypothetical protein [bacterium]
NTINMEHFLKNTLHITKLTKTDARELGIDTKTFDELNVNEDAYVDVDELMDELADEGSDLYEQFAVMYEDNQKKTNDNKKEENTNKVNSKGDMKK